MLMATKLYPHEVLPVDHDTRLNPDVSARPNIDSPLEGAMVCAAPPQR